jgi:hypothetical protein
VQLTYDVEKGNTSGVAWIYLVSLLEEVDDVAGAPMLWNYLRGPQDIHKTMESPFN